MNGLEVLLSRLKKVRKNGKDYLACCPAHQDKSPSLTIAEKADGKVLIHCFAGCSPAEIVAAVGMNLSELMPESLRHHGKKEPRPFNPYHVMAALADDLTVALLLAKDVQRGIKLTESESLIMAKIIGRVSMAIALAGGRT